MKQLPCRFDDALPRFAHLVAQQIGDSALDRNAFLRDADGVLTLILRESVDNQRRDALETAAIEHLQGYAARQPISSAADIFDPTLDDSTLDHLELVRLPSGPRFVRLLERRVVGQDWLRGIQPNIPDAPPIVVFASHKGGVGRSTALSIAANHFASQGKSILAIDLDLEAPGLGGMFLAADELPQYGALDYYVERGRSIIDEEFYRSLVAESTLPRAVGRLFIIPAAGKLARTNPQNVIPKLARSYLEDAELITDEVVQLSFLDKTRILIQELCKIDRYDAIFLDARSGLNESTAATIQGLGADVLFFGIDTPQTWDGYRYFLAHLARFKPSEVENDWRYRLRMVHAKAPPDPGSWSRYRDRAFELFAEHLYDELDESSIDTRAQFGFDIDDREAPHYAWPILNDNTYLAFDPILHRELVDEPIYSRTFGTFLLNLAQRLRLS